MALVLSRSVWSWAGAMCPRAPFFVSKGKDGPAVGRAGGRVSRIVSSSRLAVVVMALVPGASLAAVGCQRLCVGVTESN